MLPSLDDAKGFAFQILTESHEFVVTEEIAQAELGEVVEFAGCCRVSVIERRLLRPHGRTTTVRRTLQFLQSPAMEGVGHLDLFKESYDLRFKIRSGDRALAAAIIEPAFAAVVVRVVRAVAIHLVLRSHGKAAFAAAE